MRRLLALAVSASLLLAPAARAADPSGAPVAPAEVVIGKVFASSDLRDVYVFSGSGYRPSTRVLVAVDGLEVVEVESNSLGEFSASLTLLGDDATVLTAAGLGPSGSARVVTAAVTPEEEKVPEARRSERASDIPTRVYTNLLAGLAVVLFLVMLVIAGQAVRRRPGGPA